MYIYISGIRSLCFEYTHIYINIFINHMYIYISIYSFIY